MGEGTFSGVTIELYQDTNGNNTPDAVDMLVATTTTGAGGASVRRPAERNLLGGGRFQDDRSGGL